jgi:transposase
LAEAFAPGASVLAVARRHDISTARIYTWRNKLRQPPALTEFAEAVVDDGEQQNAHQAAMPVIIVDLGGKGRVSISASAPAALVSAALKALR